MVFVTQDGPDKVPEEIKHLAQVLAKRATPAQVYTATPSILKDSSVGKNAWKTNFIIIEIIISIDQ